MRSRRVPGNGGRAATPRSPSREPSDGDPRQAALPVRYVEDGAVAEHGHVYVAPPDRHTGFGPDGRLRLDNSPPLRFHRPSADVLFTSLAERYGDRALAVVLTGSGSDGAVGVRAVKEHDGGVIAQDEATSQALCDTRGCDRERQRSRPPSCERSRRRPVPERAPGNPAFEANG